MLKIGEVKEEQPLAVCIILFNTEPKQLYICLIKLPSSKKKEEEPVLPAPNLPVTGMIISGEARIKVRWSLSSPLHCSPPRRKAERRGPSGATPAVRGAALPYRMESFATFFFSKTQESYASRELRHLL